VRGWRGRVKKRIEKRKKDVMKDEDKKSALR
jgi:hypothetical protein